jgi:tetratricopeptide (TPR) repeat protein
MSAKRNAKRKRIKNNSSSSAEKRAPVMPRLKRAMEPGQAVFFGLSVALILLVSIAFSNCASGKYVFNDPERLLVLANSKLDLNWLSIIAARFFSAPCSQPAVDLSFGGDILAWGLNPSYSHYFNILLHICNTLLLFTLVFRIRNNELTLKSDEATLKSESLTPKSEGGTKCDAGYPAFAASVIFACHPFVCGSVAYLSGRSSLLCCAGVLVSLHCFYSALTLRNSKLRVPAYIGAAAAFSFSFLCGAQAIGAPLAAMQLVWLVKPADEPTKRWLPSVLAVIAVVAVALTCLQQPMIINNGFAQKPLAPDVYLCTQFKALFQYYLFRLFVPVGLSPDPPALIATRILDPAVLAGIASVLFVLFFGWRNRRNALVSFALALFIAGLLPWLVQPQAEYVADQRFYIPLMGMSLLFGWLISLCALRNFKLSLAILTLVVCAFAVSSISYNPSWHDQTVLWSRALKINPTSAISHAELAEGLSESGKLADALNQAEEALKIDPDCCKAKIVLGRIAFTRKQFQPAAQYFIQAIKEEEQRGVGYPQLALVQTEAANALYRAHALRAATDYAVAAITQLQQNASLHLILGSADLSNGRYLEAVDQLQKSYKLNPSDLSVCLPLAQAILAVGDFKHADIAYHLAARGLAADTTGDALTTIARAAICIGKLDVAADRLRIALAMHPNDPSAMYLLSVTQSLSGNNEASAKLKARAVALDPRVEAMNPLCLPSPKSREDEHKRFVWNKRIESTLQSQSQH